jgi:hypothetical protein
MQAAEGLDVGTALLLFIFNRVLTVRQALAFFLRDQRSL